MGPDGDDPEANAATALINAFLRGSLGGAGSSLGAFAQVGSTSRRRLRSRAGFRPNLTASKPRLLCLLGCHARLVSQQPSLLLSGCSPCLSAPPAWPGTDTPVRVPFAGAAQR